MKWVGRIFTMLLFISLIACGYFLYSLDNERKGLHADVASLSNRAGLLQKKYEDQKALTEAMLRAKQAVESRARDAEFKITELEKEKNGIKDVAAKHEKKISELRASYDEAIAAQKQQYTALRNSFDKLREESQTIIKEKNQSITVLTNERDSLDASLKQESFQNKRCREHNTELVVLTDELVGKIQNKGFFGGVNEPFTQLKKVEVEKICQEYRDKIDKGTL